MGLLDWLTEGLGDISGSMDSGMMPTPPSAMPKPDMSAQQPPQPPPPPPLHERVMRDLVEQTPPDPAMTGDANIAGTPGRMPQPVPMPQPRPDAGGGGGEPAPGPPPSLAPPAPSVDQRAQSLMDRFTPQGPGIIGRALGLDAGGERKLMSSLGAGLKSVGDNWSKPGLAAFSGSAGSALEGADKSTQQEYDNKIKALGQAVSYLKADDEAGYKKAYVEYLGASLKDKTDKAATAKAAWNKPDSQRFIDAMHALSRDPDIMASQKLLEQAARTGEPADVAKAKATHDALVQQKRGDYLHGVGLDPQKAAAQAANPPGGVENPHAFTGDPKAIKQQFDTYVRPGQYYVNPRDGKVYVRKGGGGTGGESPSGAASFTRTPRGQPAPVDPMHPANPPAASDGADED